MVLSTVVKTIEPIIIINSIIKGNNSNSSNSNSNVIIRIPRGMRNSNQHRFCWVLSYFLRQHLHFFRFFLHLLLLLLVPSSFATSIFSSCIIKEIQYVSLCVSACASSARWKRLFFFFTMDMLFRHLSRTENSLHVSFSYPSLLSLSRIFSFSCCDKEKANTFFVLVVEN